MSDNNNKRQILRDVAPLIILAFLAVGYVWGAGLISEDAISGIDWGNFTVGINTPSVMISGVDYTASIVAGGGGTGGTSRQFDYTLTLSAGSVTVYKIDGTNFTVADDIDAFNWVTGNLTNGGSIYIKRASNGAAYTFTSLPWLIYNDNIQVYSDNATITCTNDLIEYEDTANDFPAPSWALLHINSSSVLIEGLTFDGNGDTMTAVIPDNGDERACITAMPGSNGLFSAPILSVPGQHGLTLRNIFIKDAYRVGLWVGKYNNTVLDHVTVKNIHSPTGRKGIVLSWVDGAKVISPTVVFSTEGNYFQSSNALFYIRMTNNGVYKTGVRNVITSDFYLEGSIDSTIEQLGGSTASNANFNNLFSGGIIKGRGCYTSQNGFNMTFADIDMYYCGGINGSIDGFEQGAGGFNAGHNIASSTDNYIHDITFDNCWVYLINGSLREGFRHVSNGGIITDIIIKNSGVRLPEDYETGDQARGVYIDGSSTAAPNHVTRFIIDNFYCNSVGPGVEVDGTVAASNIWVLNSQFINMGQVDDGSYYGVKHDGAGWIYVKDNVFFDDVGYMDYGVDITSTADGKFIGNLVNCTTGIRLGASSGNWTVAWNDFTGCTTTVTNSGADALVYGDNFDETGAHSALGS